MPLILRAVKGSKLTISEMDGDLLWLAGNISGSGVIPVTGSGIDASTTPITSSFFVGDGSKLTNITASFITSSNVYGPYGSDSILSSSFAISASYILSASYALTSSHAISASRAVSSSYALTSSYSTTLVATVSNPSDGSLRLANSAGSTISSIDYLTASLAFTASLALTSSYVTASNVFGPYGSNSVISSSYALSASYTLSASQATSASYSLTASYAQNSLSSPNLKAGSASIASFTGDPLISTITFGTAFSNNNYAVTVTGEDARSWSIQSKTNSGFTINSNDNVTLLGPVYWIATAYNS